MTGITWSSASFPAVPGGSDLKGSDGVDGFVAKVPPNGIGLQYLAFIVHGEGRGIAVDSSGNTYVTGLAHSLSTGALPSHFPVKGGLDSTGNGGTDGFVAKIDLQGNLVYAGFIGGGQDDEGRGIAVDSQGNAYVAGNTKSPDFPAKGSLDPTFNGGQEAFVAKIDPTGTSVLSAGLIGGNSHDSGNGIATDPSGNVYVTGGIYIDATSDFRAKGGPDLTPNGGYDAFIMKLGPLSASSFEGLDPELKLHRCGDRVMDTGEQCDDGNTKSGDGCSSQCRSEGRKIIPKTWRDFQKSFGR